MTAIVPPVREDGGVAGEKGADGAPEGATTLTVAQRRWCIGAAVVVMGLASLGTALYQTNASDVDPANADAIAPLETAQSGSPAVPPAAGAGMQGVTALPPGYPGLSDPALGAMGAPGVGGLPPLSLMPAPAAGGAMASPYAATPPAGSRALANPPSALGSSALPPGASLPAAGATAPSSAAGTTPPVGTSRTGAAAGGAATPYRQTGTPGVIEVAPGQAPPPGYRRVYPGAPRAQAAPGTNSTSRQSGTYQQRTTPGTTQPRYRTNPYGQQTSPNGTSTTPQRRVQPQSPSGTQTTPTQPAQPTAPNLLGGLGG